jgi:hypothetical protein
MKLCLKVSHKRTYKLSQYIFCRSANTNMVNIKKVRTLEAKSDKFILNLQVADISCLLNIIQADNFEHNYGRMSQQLSLLFR